MDSPRLTIASRSLPSYCNTLGEGPVLTLSFCLPTSQFTDLFSLSLSDSLFCARLMEKVKAYLVKVAESAKQPQSTITAALLEAYSRLLIWLGTRNFQSETKSIRPKGSSPKVYSTKAHKYSLKVSLQLSLSLSLSLSLPLYYSQPI